MIRVTRSSLFGCAALSAVLAAGAMAASIRYTSFDPDRCYANQAMVAKWGQPYQWPLKSFPKPSKTWPGQLTSVYGLVYWPGEVIAVTVDGATTAVERISCVNVCDPADSLATAKTSASSWTITTTGNKSAPYMAVYRVRAFAGSQEIASRGLVVALPWSPVKLRYGNPYFYTKQLGFAEWCNGDNPFCYMALGRGWNIYGAGGEENQANPYRNRPWGEVDIYGLPEIYQYRQNYVSRLTNWMDPASITAPTTGSYLDPSFDWNLWWTYYGRGLSKWEGDWQFGPFSKLSAGQIVTNPDRSYDICYADLRKYGGVMPNGLLFWQWNYYGLTRAITYMIRAFETVNKVYAPQMSITNYDGYYESGKVRVANSDEVGMIPLYYQRCQAMGTATSWTQDYPYFWSFVQHEWNVFDGYNDLLSLYRNLDLNRRNFFVQELACYDVYRQVTGKGVVDYHSGEIGRPIGQESVFNWMEQDRRWVGAQWNDIFNNGYGADLTGFANGDLTHNYSMYVGQSYFKNTRWYRAKGIRDAANNAFWPQCYYGGGYRFSNAGMFPGTANDTAVESGIKPLVLLINRLRDDGTSFRRMDMADRVPMFYRPGGSLSSYEQAYCFQTYDENGETNVGTNPLWVTQAVLGQQLLEIPDRLRPIGGVLIMDSDNKADRDVQRQFVTDRPTSDYLCAVMDSLGISTYANSDVDRDIPADIPRVYAPRYDGGTQAYLIAKVNNATVRVPYTLGDQVPSSTNFKSFVSQIKAACPGGRPIATTGGFVATAWESSRGVWVYVENPMQDSAVIHTARTGTVSVKVRGLKSKPPVIDLCGYDPDPNRLPDSLVSVSGEFVTFKLAWARGDARVFWINAVLPSPVTAAVPANTLGSRVELRVARRALQVSIAGRERYDVRLVRVDGRAVWQWRGTGTLDRAADLHALSPGWYVLRVRAGDLIAARRVAVE